MSTIVDTHCHIQFPQYDADRGEMIKQTLEGGVFMICVGTDLETSKAGIELAQKHEGIWATVGLHPNDNLDEKFDPKEYEELLKMPKVVAMGEIGLDYYRTTEEQYRKFQKERFEQQLELATKLNIPVILHSRDAGKGSMGLVHDDMISILDSCFKIHSSRLRGVAHSFTGSLDEAKKYLDLGFYLGFNGIITFLPAGRQVQGQYDEVVKYAPLDRILIETDAPYLSPEPYRGQRNEPLRVIEVAKKIAELKNESYEKVIEITTKNCKDLFNI